MYNLLLFHGNKGCANARQYYAILSPPVSLPAVGALGLFGLFVNFPEVQPMLALTPPTAVKWSKVIPSEGHF